MTDYDVFFKWWDKAHQARRAGRIIFVSVKERQEIFTMEAPAGYPPAVHMKDDGNFYLWDVPVYPVRIG